MQVFFGRVEGGCYGLDERLSRFAEKSSLISPGVFRPPALGFLSAGGGLSIVKAAETLRASAARRASVLIAS